MESAKTRYVAYRYAWSCGIFTFFGRSSPIELQAGQSGWLHALPYTLLSLLLGWWGIPWGPIKTFQALSVNLSGGEDLTLAVNKAIHGVEEPEAKWNCPECKRPNPNTTFRCVCGYRLA